MTSLFSYDPTIEQRKLLDEHLRLVLEVNKTHNLTRITSWEQAQVLHVEDSLVGLPELQQAPDGLYADLGSGGGFPGIPLAIMSGRKTILVDSVAKKMNAVNRIIVYLGLKNQITTYAGRIKDLSRQHPNEFAAVTARALSSLPSLLELASPLLQLTGNLICYKAQPGQEEIELACSLEDKLGMSFQSERQVILSDGCTQRSILVFKKVKPAQVPLPRRVGMAQKRPYTS